jgi:hypothetical protein
MTPLRKANDRRSATRLISRLVCHSAHSHGLLSVIPRSRALGEYKSCEMRQTTSKLARPVDELLRRHNGLLLQTSNATAYIDLSAAAGILNL